MSKYFHCADCGNIFAEDAAASVLIDEGYGDRVMYACPDCRSIELAQAGECLICGKPINPNGDDYCDDCKWKARKIWEKAVCEIMALAEDDPDYCECEQRFIDYLDASGVF